jgi:uncharacterized protein (DUF1778 family)
MYGKIPYMKAKTSIAEARLELRISERDKEFVSHASELRGEVVSVFARNVLVSEARRIIESEQNVEFSAAESRRFLKALDHSFAPNAALRKALARGDKIGL